MLNLLLVILPIFLVLGTGSLFMKAGFLNENFIQTSNRLIFYFLLPSLLFLDISSSNLSQLLSAQDLLIMIVSIIVIFIFSILIAKLLHLSKESVGAFTMNNFRANYAYMGLPVSFYAFGQKGSVIGSILMAFIIPFVNILAILALNLNNPASLKPKQFIKDTFSNPLIISCLAGILFAILHIPLPGFLKSTLSMIGSVALPLALFSIGATINIGRLKGNYLPIIINVIIKLFILPLITYLIILILHIPITLTEKVLIIMLASPAATVNYVLASTMNGDTDLTTGTIMSTTVLSIISFVFWLHFLGTP